MMDVAPASYSRIGKGGTPTANTPVGASLETPSVALIAAS
jgi:hypothetical protein